MGEAEKEGFKGAVQDQSEVSNQPSHWSSQSVGPSREQELAGECRERAHPAAAVENKGEPGMKSTEGCCLSLGGGLGLWLVSWSGVRKQSWKQGERE